MNNEYETEAGSPLALDKKGPFSFLPTWEKYLIGILFAVAASAVITMIVDFLMFGTIYLGN